MKIRQLLFLVLLLGMAAGVSAQGKFDPKQSYPVDKDVLIGKLPNGLTYYVRHNEDPKNRGQFWLVVNTGSIMEDPDQNGLAHFCEHMCFNGTKRFEKDQIIQYLQSIGMKFGPEINAFTSYDLTNYMLQNVPLEQPANIDTALMILYDWACQVSFDGEEIDKERGVIHEEWRTGMGSQRRIRNAYFKVLFEGSKYASHDVIGDMNIVDHFDHEVIRRFYKDWYRPDLQAVIAIGDFDVREMQQKIVGMFSSIPKPSAPRTRTIENVPDNQETRVAIVTDKEARMVQLMMYYKHPAVTDKSTLSYSRNALMEALYNSMLNARLDELVQLADPPFINARSSYSSLVKPVDAYTTVAILNSPDISRALNAIVLENLRVLKFGFTASELERAKKEYLSAAEKMFNERNHRKSDEFAWEYFGNFLEDEPIPGAEFEYEMTQSFIPSITLTEINQLAAQWMTQQNRVVVLTAPESYATQLPDQEKLLTMIAQAEKQEVQPYVDKVSGKPLYSLSLKPGTVKKETFNAKDGYYEWKLSNGATVVIKPTRFKEDEILFSAFSTGGTSQYSDKDLVTAQNTSSVIDMSGIGDFDNIELQKLLADKVVRISPYISGLEEGFSGSSTPKDFETLLQLTNLYFMDPRADEQAFQSFIKRQQAMLKNKANDPSTAFSDTLTNTLYQYHPRRRPMSAEILAEADFSKMEKIFAQRFSNGKDWTFYFVGNIDPVTAKPLVEKYLGSIPSKGKKEHFIDRKEYTATGVIKKRVTTSMQVPKATVAIMQGGEFDYSPRERMLLSFINDILDQKYTQTIREKESGTYGVSVQTSMQQEPVSSYRLITYFTCAPEKADILAPMIYQQIDLLKTEGPTKTELDNVIENKIKERAEQVKENRFWLRGLKFLYENGQNNMDDAAYTALVKSITAKDVQEAAKKYYNGSNILEIIQMPKE
jgi:zinc protease